MTVHSNGEEALAAGTVAQNLAVVRTIIGNAAQRTGRPADSVELLLVTKTVPPERVQEAIAAGQKLLGENKVQEGRAKAEALSANNVRWSMIGHLQTNKVRDVLRFASEVQSLDRISLAEALDRRLQRIGRSLDVLVQVNTSQEASKYGIAPNEAVAFLKQLTAFHSLRVRGFMTLARFTADTGEIRRCFRNLRSVRDRCQDEALHGHKLQTLSMGMSGDYEVAIEEGATVVRVGQAVFGARPLPDAYYWPDARSEPVR